MKEMTKKLPQGITGHSGNEDPQGRNDSDLNRFNFFKTKFKTRLFSCLKTPPTKAKVTTQRDSYQNISK